MMGAYTLTVALGGSWSRGSGIACCPAHEDRSPSLSLADGTDGRLLLHCHAGCSFGDVQNALQEKGLLAQVGTFSPVARACNAERRAAEAAFLERRMKQARKLWDEAEPIDGTPAELYLRRRGITCPLPPTLRYIGECWHQSAQRAPAMLANVYNISERNRSAIHRTYLRGDGKGKAKLLPNKAMLGPVSGGAVSLSKHLGPLVVTEGIETGLSILSGLLEPDLKLFE